MSVIDQPVRPDTKRHEDENDAVLREHLSDNDAALLAGRMRTFEHDAKSAEDWSVVKARLLQQVPRL